MPLNRQILVFVLILLTFACGAQSRADSANDKVVTLLFTNDIESAYESVPAWWLTDIERIGGIAELSTLIRQLRKSEPNVFLFDAGDIFTGALSRLTDGALMFEFMMTMGYDAMGIGNHEFDYGETILQWQKNRVTFPVLGANLFYKGTNHPFAQAHTIIERDGIRIGVIGILGQDAASTAIARDHIDELDVTDPATAVARSVAELRGDVDLIVLLTHMGHTAPMQTDAEADPRLARDINADIALAGAVDGIDVLFGGHADAGTPQAVRQEKTGTLIMQTYGQATYLGFLQLTLDGKTGKIKSHDSKLIPVDTMALIPDPEIVKKNDAYRDAHPEIMEVVGRNEARLNRKYFDEADIGNLIADILVDQTGADIGLMHPGGIRRDLPRGDVRVMDILDTNPFVDSTLVMGITGAQLKQILEQSFSQLRGLMQVSGIETKYNTSMPIGSRLISVTYENEEVSDTDTFSVAVAGIIARGGDHYDTFLNAKFIREFTPIADLMTAYYKKHGDISMPKGGRQLDVASKMNDEKFESVDTTVQSRGVAIPVTYVAPLVAAGETFPLIVMAHGRGGTRHEAGGFRDVAQGLAENGIASIRMDFPGCGDSIEPFTENNLSNMLLDLQASRTFAASQPGVDNDRVGVVGYSMGGRLAALLSEIDASYKAMAIWAPSVANGAEHEHRDLGGFDTYSAFKQQALAEGFAPFTTRYGQDLQLSHRWFTDLENTMPLAALQKFEGPLLVVYGDQDDNVLPSTSRAAVTAAGNSSAVIGHVVEGAGHGFGFYTDEPAYAEEVVTTTVEFLRDRL